MHKKPHQAALHMVWIKVLFLAVYINGLSVVTTIMAYGRQSMNYNYCFVRRYLIMDSKIEILSTVTVEHSDDLYKIVDLLNRTLKRNDLMFGLALDEEDQKQAIFTIYRT